MQGAHRRTVTVMEGRGASLQCQASGVPIPQLQFFKNGLPLESLDLGGGRREFTVAAAKLADSGVYFCRATNEAGSAQQEIHVNVQVPPVIAGQTSVDVVRVRSGNAAFLECSVSGAPPPETSWIFNGRLLTGSEPRIQVRPMGIVVTDARASDSGKYSCAAVNDVGTTNKDFVLDVLGERLRSCSLVHHEITLRYGVVCPHTIK